MQPPPHRARETVRAVAGRQLLLLVGGSRAEAFALDDLAGPRCGEDEVEQVLAAHPDVELVVLGSATARPAALLKVVQSRVPRAPVVLVVSPAREIQVRYDLSCLASPPRELTVVTGVDGLRQAVTAGLARGRERRAAVPLVATLGHAPTPDAAAPAAAAPVIDLGSLLDQAPVGVVLCDTDGQLRGWNRRAAVLLDLHRHPFRRLDEALPDAGSLLRAVADRTGDGGPVEIGLVAATPGGRHLEVTAVETEAVEGRLSVLLLLVDVTEQRRAERDRERLSRQVDLLGRTSEALVSSLDIDEALERLAAVLVPEFADWVSIQLTDELGELSLVTVRHRDPALEAVVTEVEQRQSRHASDEAPSRRVVRGDGPLLLRQVDEEELERSVRDEVLRDHFRTLGVSSLIAVPLPGRDGILGSMVLVRDETRQVFRQSHLSVAVEAGRRAGIALDNARLYAQQHELAGELQRSLLTAPPQVAHGAIAVRYVAAAHEAQVGGDWYDAFVQRDGATVLVVGDVVGHDRRAAAGMSQVRGVLRGIGYTTGAGPGELLTRADQAMAGLGIQAMATALVVRIEPIGAERPDELALSWSSAGHPPMLVLTPDGEVRVLTDATAPTGPDLLLGLDPETQRSVTSARVPDGSTLFLYSDGLVERRGEDLDDGISRLADALAFGPEDEPLEELCDRVLEQLLPVEPDDDVALVAIRLRGASPESDV